MFGRFFKTEYTPHQKKIIVFLRNELNVRPKNINYYSEAMRHKSVVTAGNGSLDSSFKSNERLEFLGDAVLDMIIADYVFSKFPNEEEGFLTNLRAKIVRREQLNALALKLGLDKLLDSKAKNIPEGSSIYGNAFEALVGALYLDLGYKTTNQAVINYILVKHFQVESLRTKVVNYKSKLFEWAQKHKQAIRFEVKEQREATTKSKNYYATVFLDNEQKAIGIGSSKKKAEQRASMKALTQLVVPTEVELN